MNINTSHQELLDNLFDGVYYVDKERRITYWNKAAERITGFQSSEVLGSLCSDNILRHINTKGHELCTNGCPLHITIGDGKMRDVSLFLHHKMGHRVPVQIRIAPIMNEAGEIIGGVEVFSDNSKTIEVLEKLEEMKKEVFIDALLQIGNRRYAEMVFETQLYELKAFNVSFCVVLLDIDKFKQINDKFGHIIGDKILLMVTKTIQNILRNIDAIARWGGDELLVFIPNATQSGLKEILNRIRIFVEKSFIVVNNEKISVTVSLGATFAKAEDTLETIIDRADSQMYNSKRDGGNCFTIG